MAPLMLHDLRARIGVEIIYLVWFWVMAEIGCNCAGAFAFVWG